MKRVYVMGLPRVFSQDKTKVLIEGADFCVMSTAALKVGDQLCVAKEIFRGNGEGPTVFSTCTVVKLEERGRIAYVAGDKPS